MSNYYGDGKPRPRGKPFTGADDPRRSQGRSALPVTRIAQKLARDEPALVEAFVRRGFEEAAKGNVHWATFLASYLDGKPLGREERGSPGEFNRIDLSEYSSVELRNFIRAVRPPEEEIPQDPLVALELSEPPPEASEGTHEDD